MKLTNNQFIRNYLFFQIVLLLILIGIMIWYFTAPQIVQYNNKETIIGVLIFYLVGEYILYLRKYYLLSYTDENGIIEFIYSSAKKKISFPHEKLENYKIKASGLRRELILFEKLKEGIKEHPSISLSAFSKDDMKKLISSLENILSKNKQKK